MCMQISPIHITFDLKFYGFYGVGKAYLHAFKRITISPAILQRGVQPRTVYRWTKEILLFFCPLQGRVGVGWNYSFCSLQGWGGIKNDVAHWYSFIARGIVRSKKISSSQEIVWLRLILQKTNHENNAIQCSCLHSIFVTMFGLIVLAGWR